MTKIKFLFLLIFIVIEVILFLFLGYLKSKDVDQFKNTYKSYHLTQPLNATTGFYKNSARSIYEFFINKEDILSIVHRAANTNDVEVQKQERQKLYDKLIGKYEVIKKRGIKQLHFHFKDTTIFLRFHKPGKFGDNLSNIRHSLVIANKEKRFVEGYEEGRIFNGYRYVFPLSYRGEHIGSVEVSIGFNAIAKILHRDFHLQPYMILKDDVVKEKVFSNERRNYDESIVSSKYYHEVNKYDNIHKFDFNEETISKEVFEETLSKYKNEFNEVLEKNEFFQYFDNHTDFSYIISFYPITNIKGASVGYIVLMDKNYDYIKIEKEFLYRFLTISFFIIVTILFIFRLEKFNIELLESEKKAKEVTQAKSEFLANMSHEIRTPLNAIFGYINLLTKMEHPHKVERYLNTIMSSSQTLFSVINDILDFSKIESGKFSFEMIDFDTKELFGQLYQMFVPAANDKKISLSLTYDSYIEPYIRTDMTRIKQVVSNLISNAIKFTPEFGTIDIRVKCENERLHVEIIDSGIGVPEDKQKSIFLKFEQADGSTTRKYGGTGLGLAISYFIIENLGGELKVKSEPEKGSTFYFDIPVEYASKVALKDSVNNAESHFAGDVLLVEDNKTNQMMMKIILEEFGLEIDVANDGLEAIEFFKKEKYDIIFMDENMPNMNGIEATKKILKLQGEGVYPVTPIIALTADAIDGAREKYLETGMQDYLSKPLDESDLIRVLNRYLSNS